MFDRKFNLIILILSVFIILSCNESEEIPGDETVDLQSNISESEYVEKILPSIIGYFNEAKGGLHKVISHSAKSDSKSKYINVIFETTSSEIAEVNFHYEGEYNQTSLSVHNPFMVICEAHDDCNNCGFKTTDEGTVCGCNIEGRESPCQLTIDHIIDFDFYANYHQVGLELMEMIQY